MRGCAASIGRVSCGNGSGAIRVMSPGISAPAALPAAQRSVDISLKTTPCCGGFTFAERPDLEAPDARIIWHADIDPGILNVIATPTVGHDPNGVDPALLTPWLTTVADGNGAEHAVLSDGWHHIRLDLDAGSLVGEVPVVFSYRILGIAGALAKILPLRRLIYLCRYRRFAASLFPEDRRIDRGLELLRVHDALAAGASQREIAQALFGEERVAREWSGASDSLRSRTRRLIRDAVSMAEGGYQTLLRGDRMRK